MTLKLICVTLLWIAVAGAAYYYGRAEESRRWCAAENDTITACMKHIEKEKEGFPYEMEWFSKGVAAYWDTMQSSEEKHNVL